MSDRRRLLIVGLDGATWDVLDPLIRDGTMPRLARLRDSGTWGRLRSTIPPITPAAWTTMTTGKRPGRHGVFHFLNLFGSEDHADDIVSARSVRSPGVWDVLGYAGRRVGLVNIPLTYPPRAVNGFMVTGLLTPANATVFTYPPELSTSLPEHEIEIDRFAGKVPFVDAIDGEAIRPSLDLVNDFVAMLERRTRETLALMAREPWDVFMTVFMETDRLGHYLWAYHPPGPGVASDLRAAVRTFYARLDDALGSVLDAAGPEVDVLVVSDHGMGPKHLRRFHANAWLLETGLLCRRRSSSKASRLESGLARVGLRRDRLGRLLRRVPGLGTSRALRRVAERTAGATVDETASLARAVPIFRNIFGIRAAGEGAVLEDRLRELETRLAGLRDPATGQPVVRDVQRGATYFAGAEQGLAPDLIVELDETYAASFYPGDYSSFFTPVAEESVEGTHRIDGILLVAGPSIEARTEPVEGLRIEDVAPTILRLVGLPAPEDMDGRAMATITAGGERLDLPGPAMRWWPHETGPSFVEDADAADDEELVRSRLEALGYLE
jgi:predicted AlkP superfamily phosphohydrolase/phosphomutase